MDDVDAILAGLPDLYSVPDFDSMLESMLGGDPTPQPGKPPEYDENGNRRRIGLDRDPSVRTESPKRKLQRLSRVGSAVAQIGELPSAGEELVLILTGGWHGWDLVEAVLELTGETVEELHVATLGFNRTQTENLGELLDSGRLGAVTMVVSDYFTKTNRDEFAILKTTLEKRGQHVATGRNHAKLMLFRFADSVLACHGSLNLRRCNSFEQIAITTDRKLYDFFRTFIEEVQAADTVGGAAQP
jgi:hypothetical protein